MVSESLPVGTVGSVTIGFSGGKGSVAFVAEDAKTGTGANVAVTQDATPLANALFSLIEKISPAGLVPIEEGAKAAILANLANIT